MSDSGTTSPATTWKGFGGWTLLLALTLSVQAAAVSSAMPHQRPAMVDAVVRFLAQVAHESHARDDRRVVETPTSATTANNCGPIATTCQGFEACSILIELLNLPPPARG